MEELQIRQIEADIRSLDSMSNFFNGLSTMWILFGIGGILFGIGYSKVDSSRTQTLKATRSFRRLTSLFSIS